MLRICIATALGLFSLAAQSQSLRSLDMRELPPTYFNAAELSAIVDPDKARLDALSAIERDFRAECPRLAQGDLDRTGGLVMLQWSALNRPEKFASYYFDLKEARKAACGDRPSAECEARYADLAHDVHLTNIPTSEFIQWNAQARIRLGAAMKADASMPSRIAAWGKGSVEDRMGTMAYVVDKIRAAYSQDGLAFGMPKLELLSRTEEERKAAYIVPAEYRYGSGTILFDRLGVERYGFEVMYAQAQHETTHHIQFELAKALYEDGNVRPKDLGMEKDVFVGLVNMTSWTYFKGVGGDREHVRYLANPIEVIAVMNETDITALRLRKGRFTSDGRKRIETQVREERSGRLKNVKFVADYCRKPN